MTEQIQRLLEIHARNADADEDLRWYKTARIECAKRALALGVPMDTYLGVVAAMSPIMPWQTTHGKMPNLDAADRVFRGEGRGLKTSLARAQRIVEGEDPRVVLGTAKTRNFFENLQRDDSDAVTIDRWMLRAMDAPAPGTQTAYDALADHVRTAARHAGITPHALQASVWAQIKREAA